MKTKEKNYVIKIPVYTTEIFENPIDLFGGISRNDMINYIKSKVSHFSQITKSLSFDNKNKTKKTVINNIEIHDIEDNEFQGLLLQVSAYTTNLYDGYLEADEIINFERNHKIGSRTNFIMIYPIIKGISRDNFLHHYIVLVYEDPTKNNEDLIKITKNLLNKVFNIPIANIKLPTILEELRQIKVIPDLKIKYSAIFYNSNEVELLYREYLVDGKFRKEKEDHFKNMPFEKVEKLITDHTEDGYQKKEAKLINGKKEYKITNEQLMDASENYNLTAEKVFNATTAITQAELDNNMHDIDFIKGKLFPILEEFLSNN